MKKYIAYFSPVILFLALTFMSFSSRQEQFTKSSDDLELLYPRVGNSDQYLDNYVSAPIIDIWYGDTQEFGNNGEPQVWCNIQGNITDDGTINSFTYSLNGGNAINLSIGPDSRRLVNSGDFNIDIDVTNLLPGSNTVLISATDNDNDTSTKIVTINYTSGNIWPIPYNVDWNSLNNDITKVNEVAHVVDGKFTLTPDGIRTAEPGYDRLIAMGDITSNNYEVLVPVTIHSMPSNFGVGVLLRWKGHTDTPVSCSQPKCGYEPHGAISWFRSSKLEFYQGNSVSFTPLIDVTYMLRTSVETETATGNTNYRIKFWEQGSTEPVAWSLEQTNDASDEQEGSLMLISHKADVTFGNVTVTPGSLSISNIQTQLTNNNTEATITWNTNQPTTSRIDYGLTASYEIGFLEDTNLVTSHSISLTGLTPETIYQYKISGVNSGMEAVERAGLILSTFTSGIKSDDFCGNSLDPVWTFDNPLSDGSFELTGSGTNDAFLEISVPSGSEHQIYTSGINAPNMMQSINNSDFEVEVKFESGVIAPQYQQQGILVKESNNRFLRFEFYSKDGNQTYLYAQAFDLPSAQTAYINTSISAAGIAPLYMKVKREGNDWTLSYSFDGINFTVGTSFFNDMVPTQIGPYAGNAIGSSSPAHTAKIDYFLNLADPIISEDSCVSQQPPVLAYIGDQSVEVTNSLSLTLTATDSDGNDFEIDFTETGLPSFALLTDNNDGTASLDIDPLLGDEGTYTMTIIATDSDGLTDDEEFDIVVTDENNSGSNLVSDDFCDDELDPIWTFYDPLGDGNYTLTRSTIDDAFLEIMVPGGLSHELWTSGITAPHVMQLTNDTDFELEVKMESPVSAPAFQEQGILIRQDEYHFLRFEFYSNNSNTYILAATLESDTNTFPLDSDIHMNINIGPLDTAPLYMSVKREANLWTQSYSFDGQNWTEAGTFTYEMVVSGTGLYCGNASGGSAPAHTAQFDYFKNIEDPIINEDGCDVNCTSSTTWDGLEWSNDEPDMFKTANIAGEYNTSVNGNIDACEVNVSLGFTLIITAGNYIKTENNIIVDGTLQIEHEGSVVQVDDDAITVNNGSILVTKVTPTLRDVDFTILGSPMTNETREDVYASAAIVRNHITSNFVPYPNGVPAADNWADDNGDNWLTHTGTLVPGAGYLVKPQLDPGGSDATYQTDYTEGTLNSGDITFTPVMNGGGQDDSPNMLSNPYASGLDINTFLSTNLDAGGAVYFWEHLLVPDMAFPGYDPLANYNMNDISSHNGSVGTASASGSAAPGSAIPSGQGFGIKPIATTTITFTNVMRVGTNTGYKNSETLDVLRLQVSNDTYSLQGNMALGFTEANTNEIERSDIKRLATSISLFSVEDEMELGIQMRSVFNEDQIIPLGFHTFVDETQTYTISLSDVEGELISQATVYLRDNLLNNRTNLSETDYVFTANLGYQSNRFVIVFSNDILGTNELNLEAISLYPNPTLNILYINSPLAVLKNVEIFDLRGRKIGATNINYQNFYQLNMSNLKSAIYFIKIITDKGTITKKVVKE